MKVHMLSVALCGSLAMLTGCASAPRHAALTPVPPGSEVRLEIDVLAVASPDAMDAGEAMGRGAA